MNKTLTIALRELIWNIKRKEFIFMTFGLPFFMIALMIIPFVIGIFSLPQSQNIGYVDSTGKLEIPPDVPTTISDIEDNPLLKKIGTPDVKYGFTEFASQVDAMDSLLRDEIDAYFIFPEDYFEKGEVFYYSKKSGFSPTAHMSLMESILLENLLSDVPPEKAARIKNPAILKSTTLDEKGKEVEGSGLTRFLVPYFFGVLMMVSIFASSNFLLMGVVEEKESRIAEILLSSANPFQIMSGKILGLAVAGLIQVTVWLIMAAIPSVTLLSAAIITPGIVLLAVIFFIPGYLLYSSIMASIGAISTSMREGQQIASLISLLAVIPIILAPYILENPNTTLSKIFTLFPFTSPIVVMLRSSVGGLPIIEMGLSLAILIVTVYVFFRLSGRVFRLGFLIYGRRPTPMEILRNLKG